MAMEEYTETAEKDILTQWLDKKKLIGKELDFEIEKVYKLQNDMVLSLIHDEITGPQSVRISSKMKNELIDKFGNKPNEWIANTITIKFSEFKPKDNQKNISEGVQMSLVWYDEENFEE